MDYIKWMGRTAIVLVCVAICTAAVALAVPYWLHMDVGVAHTHAGLWTTCVHNFMGVAIEICISDHNVIADNTTMILMRVFMIVGIVFSVVCLALSNWAIFQANRIFGNYCAESSSAGGVFIGAAVYLFINNVIANEQLDGIHVGMPLAAVASVADVVAGACFWRSRPPPRAIAQQEFGMQMEP